MSSLKVLIVEGALLPAQMSHWEETQRLGVDLHIAGTLRELKRKWPTTGVPEGVNTHLFEPRGWLRRGSLWWVYPGLRRLIRDLKPDLIHIANEPWALFYSQVFVRGPSVVAHGADNIWEHGSWAERKLRLLRARRTLGRLQGFASWNAAGVELAQKHGLDATLPTLVAPARLPDPSPFRKASLDRKRHRAEHGIGSEVAIGYVGRLQPEKGVGWLLDSIATAQLLDANLLVFGTGPQEAELRNLADALGVRAAFCGPMDSEQIPGVMASIDLLVVPSLRTPSSCEQFGRVVIEAMFAGTAVISSDSGALPEVVGDGGILVPEGDVAGLANAIKNLVNDETMRHRVAQQGLSWANSQYGPTVLARAITDFWEAVLSH